MKLIYEKDGEEHTLEVNDVKVVVEGITYSSPENYHEVDGGELHFCIQDGAGGGLIVDLVDHSKGPGHDVVITDCMDFDDVLDMLEEHLMQSHEED